MENEKIDFYLCLSWKNTVVACLNPGEKKNMAEGLLVTGSLESCELGCSQLESWLVNHHLE
jgi:hypothetical protein